jgi:hypothetical protein
VELAQSSSASVQSALAQALSFEKDSKLSSTASGTALVAMGANAATFKSTRTIPAISMFRGDIMVVMV